MKRLALFLLFALILPQSFAQSYPSKPIRFIVPWGAGASPDIASRTVAAELARQLGQPIVIDNRPGAGGTVGTALSTLS